MTFNFLIKGLKYVLKHKTIFSLTGIGAITGSTVISPFIAQAVEDAAGNYLFFDDQFFDDELALLQYIDETKTVDKFNATQTGYVLNNQYFDSIGQITKYLDKNHPITSLWTKHDPANYIISGDGSLAKSVLMDLNDDVVKVYGTINDTMTFDEKEAIASYANANSTTEYQVLLESYKSFEAAKRQYIDGLKADLENNKSKAYTVYSKNGLDYTAEEIKDSLRKKMERGFEYHGQTFYEADANEFKKVFADEVSEEFLENNIKKIKNPNMRSYWVNVGKVPENDYFSSPKYIEINEDMPVSPKFVETSSTAINQLNPLWMNTLTSTLISVAMGLVSELVEEIFQKINQTFNSDFWTHEDQIKQTVWWNYGIHDLKTAKSRSLEVVLSELKKDKAIGETEFNDFMELYSQYTNEEVKSQLFAKLDGIHDDEFPTFNKILVAFKRLNTFLKLYSTENISPDFHLKLIESLRKIILSYINLNAGSMFDIVGPEVGAIFNDLSFEQLYDFFINPAAFSNYLIGEDNKYLYDTMIRLDDTIGSIVSDSTPKFKEASEETRKFLHTKIESPNPADINSTKKVLDWSKKMADKSATMAYDGMLYILEKLNLPKLLKLGLDTLEDVFPLAKFVGRIWELGNIFSFSDIVNLEYKLDDNQKMEYMTMVYKVPLLGIRLNQPNQPNVKLEKLTEAPLKFMTGVQSDENAIYEVAGKYYLNYRYAKDALMQDVYLHPQKYLNVKQVLRNSSFPSHRPWLLFDGNAPIVGNGTNGTIRQEDYDSQLAEEINDFTNTLFEQEYENGNSSRKTNVYLDGFGNSFTSMNDAFESIKNRADDKRNYNVKYVYKTRNNLVSYFNSEKERNDFIYQNEKVDHKDVVKSELLTHNTFSELPEYSGESYQIYHLNLYGEDKYFYSEKLAHDYLYNHILPKKVTFENNFVQYNYKNFRFNSEELFEKWIVKNTSKANNSQVRNQPIITAKKEDELYA